MRRSRRSSVSRIVLRRGSLWDGRAEEVVGDAGLVIERGIILEVGPASEISKWINHRTVVHDATGLYVVPGLLDMHIHLAASDAHARARADSIVTEQVIRTGIARAAWLVAHGVTTVRDLGGWQSAIFRLRRHIARHQLRAPRMLVAGQAIAGDAGQFPAGSVVRTGRESCGDESRRQLNRGADVLKVMVSGSGLAPQSQFGHSFLSENEVSAVVDSAALVGANVAAHAVNSHAAQVAISAGAKSIEHGIELSDETLQLMAARGIYLVPTVAIYRRNGPARSQLSSSELRRRYDMHANVVWKAHRLGVPVVAGSDASDSYDDECSVITELEWLVRYGLSATEALRGATTRGARLAGLPHVGSLDPGQAADILLVARNPLSDISALREAAGVLRAGEVVWWR